MVFMPKTLVVTIASPEDYLENRLGRIENVGPDNVFLKLSATNLDPDLWQRLRHSNKDSAGFQYSVRSDDWATTFTLSTEHGGSEQGSTFTRQSFDHGFYKLLSELDSKYPGLIVNFSNALTQAREYYAKYISMLGALGLTWDKIGMPCLNSQTYAFLERIIDSSPVEEKLSAVLTGIVASYLTAEFMRAAAGKARTTMGWIATEPLADPKAYLPPEVRTGKEIAARVRA